MTSLQREEIQGLLSSTLATRDGDGFPSVAHMHIAADGLVVYVHTLAMNRKYHEMLADERVGYTVAHVPDGGFADRRMIRSVQVKGRATLVTEPDELARAVEVSMAQFPWLRDSHLYSGPQVNADQQRRAFFRIDPIEALWTDHRVKMLWRRLLIFSADGRRVDTVRECPQPTTGR